MSTEGVESRRDRVAPRELRTISIFEDLSDDELELIAAAGDLLSFRDGEIMFREGEDAVWMLAVLEGEVRSRRESGGGRTYGLKRGQVGGLLPYSRMTKTTVTGRAVGDTRVLRVHRSEFPRLLLAIPVLADRLVGVMSDRIREVSAMDQQLDKMAALGRLSAGLAHELNNPASAVLRSAEALREAFRDLRGLGAKSMARESSGADKDGLALEADLLGLGARPVPIDAIERVACEEELAAWLDARNIDAAWDIAPALVEAGITIESLERVEANLEPKGLGPLIQRLARHQQAERLIDDIELAARRISSLVDAVKQYSFMDQASIGEVDVNEGLHNTLVVLAHKVATKRAEVVTLLDEQMPRITAFGVELNQVWTNLIDNALDAIAVGGRVEIRTEGHSSFVAVEIFDDGCGIPTENLSRIFEPFFTTKRVGQGTGLGLDSVARIIRRHSGDVRVDSQPGSTRFRVTLPLTQERD